MVAGGRSGAGGPATWAAPGGASAGGVGAAAWRGVTPQKFYFGFINFLFMGRRLFNFFLKNLSFSKPLRQVFYVFFPTFTLVLRAFHLVLTQHQYFLWESL